MRHESAACPSCPVGACRCTGACLFLERARDPGDSAIAVDRRPFESLRARPCCLGAVVNPTSGLAALGSGLSCVPSSHYANGRDNNDVRSSRIPARALHDKVTVTPTPTAGDPRGSFMVLSDRSIKEELDAGRIVIEPLQESDIQPASVDIHLDKAVLVFRNSTEPYIDVRKDLSDLTERLEIDAEKPFILHPGEFVLGSTVERIELPTDIVARLEGKSSLGRIGLVIHSTAGYIDPGWKGQLTLELTNVARLPITLYYGMRIGQISFQRMTTEVDRPYGSSELGSRYQGQSDPTMSRLHLDFDKHRVGPFPRRANREG